MALSAEEAAAAFDADLEPEEAPAWASEWTETDETVRQQYRLNTDDEADWAMRKLAQAIRQVSMIDAQAEERIARIRGSRERLVAEHDRTARFFRALLEDYGRRKREADPKGPATYPLPSGDLKTTVVKPAVAFDDETGDRLLLWAAEHCRELVDVIPAKDRVLVSQVRKRVRVAGYPDGPVVFILLDEEGKPTGQQIPVGLTVRPQEITVNPLPRDT